METLSKCEELSSGKTIGREFNDDGTLFRETHWYGLLKIAIQFTFKAGTKIDETYFANKRLVSRSTYEKLRTRYPDMPPVDDSFSDWGGEILKTLKKEQKSRTERAKKHKPNAAKGQELDDFCTERLGSGKTKNAVTWIASKNHTLGERNWISSKRLVERLLKIGCAKIFACEIDDYEDGMENTGHLVVALPKEKTRRTAVLKAIHRLASETGYSGPLDDGQRYAYVKLD